MIMFGKVVYPLNKVIEDISVNAGFDIDSRAEWIKENMTKDNIRPRWLNNVYNKLDDVEGGSCVLGTLMVVNGYYMPAAPFVSSRQKYILTDVFFYDNLTDCINRIYETIDCAYHTNSTQLPPIMPSLFIYSKSNGIYEKKDYFVELYREKEGFKKYKRLSGADVPFIEEGLVVNTEIFEDANFQYIMDTLVEQSAYIRVPDFYTLTYYNYEDRVDGFKRKKMVELIYNPNTAGILNHVMWDLYIHHADSIEVSNGVFKAKIQADIKAYDEFVLNNPTFEFEDMDYEIAPMPHFQKFREFCSIEWVYTFERQGLVGTIEDLLNEGVNEAKEEAQDMDDYWEF